MRRSTGRGYRGAARLLAAFLLTGTVTFAVDDVRAQEKLKVGEVYVWLGDLPLYVAQDKGLYAKHGVEVEFFPFRGGGELATALASGSVDVAVGSVDHAIKMRDKGLDAKIVQVVQERFGLTLLKPTGGVGSIKELKGKVLATAAKGSAADNYMRYLMLQHGLDIDRDATIIAAGGNDGRVAALKQKSVAAAAVSEPATAIVLKEGFGEVLHDGTAWEYPFNVVIVKRDILERRAAAIRAFVSATLEGARLSRSTPEEAERVALKWFPSSDTEVIRQATRNYLPTFSTTGLLTEKGTAFAMELLLATKAIDRSVPLGELADHRFLGQATGTK